MLDKMPSFFHSITFDNGVCVEFNQESTINFYDKDDIMILQLDPTDVTTVYATYRAMLRESLEEKTWAR